MLPTQLNTIKCYNGAVSISTDLYNYYITCKEKTVKFKPPKTPYSSKYCQIIINQYWGNTMIDFKIYNARHDMILVKHGYRTSIQVDN